MTIEPKRLQTAQASWRSWQPEIQRQIAKRIRSRWQGYDIDELRDNALCHCWPLFVGFLAEAVEPKQAAMSAVRYAVRRALETPPRLFGGSANKHDAQLSAERLGWRDVRLPKLRQRGWTIEDLPDELRQLADCLIDDIPAERIPAVLGCSRSTYFRRKDRLFTMLAEAENRSEDQ